MANSHSSKSYSWSLSLQESQPCSNKENEDREFTWLVGSHASSLSLGVSLVSFISYTFVNKQRRITNEGART